MRELNSMWGVKFALGLTLVGLLGGGLYWFRSGDSKDRVASQSLAINWKKRLEVNFGIPDVVLSGKKVLVHVWASWCPPCVEEMPRFRKFVEGSKFPPSYLAVAVSLDEKKQDALALLPGFDGNGGNFYLVFDSARRFSESLGSYQYPETFLIEENGEWSKKWVGPQDWDGLHLVP
jgi:thiol-disulfide isomerase/thioredoxin